MDNIILGSILAAILGGFAGSGLTIWNTNRKESKQEKERLNYLRVTLCNIIVEIILPNLKYKYLEFTNLVKLSESELISNHHFFVDTRILKNSLLNIFDEYDLIKIFNVANSKNNELSFSKLYKLIYNLDTFTEHSGENILNQFIERYYKIISGEIQSFDVQQLKYENPDLDVNDIFARSTKSLNEQNHSLLLAQINVQINQIIEVTKQFLKVEQSLRNLDI